MLDLNLLHRKRSKSFSKLIRVQQTSASLILMFFHMNRLFVLPHKFLFAIKVLPQDTDPLHLIKEKDSISFSTIVPDLSAQTIVVLFFAIHIIRNLTGALSHFHNRTQPIYFETPHDYLLQFLQLIKL